MLNAWDYITFAVFFVVALSALLFVLFMAGLPGRIAIARKHPEAEAVNVMGWAGLLAVVPWIQAFIWAFKPTDVVDIRRFPPEEQKAIEENWGRLTAHRERRKKKKRKKREAEATPDDGDGHDEEPRQPH